MDFNTIMGAAGTIVSIAAGAFGLLKWVGKYKSNLVKAQDALYAVKAGADGLLSILAEVIADSEKNSMTAVDVKNIISTASDIPGAIRSALKLSAVVPAPAVTPVTVAAPAAAPSV